MGPTRRVSDGPNKAATSPRTRPRQQGRRRKVPYEEGQRGALRGGSATGPTRRVSDGPRRVRGDVCPVGGWSFQAAGRAADDAPQGRRLSVGGDDMSPAVTRRRRATRQGRERYRRWRSGRDERWRRHRTSTGGVTGRARKKRQARALQKAQDERQDERYRRWRRRGADGKGGPDKQQATGATGREVPALERTSSDPKQRV